MNNPPTPPDALVIKDPKIQPYLNSSAVRNSTSTIENGNASPDWSGVRTACELLKPVAGIGLTVGFALVLAYALSIGRLPRFGGAQDISILLPAFCVVGVGAWALIWVGFVAPGRIAVLSRPESNARPMERFFSLLIFFAIVCLIWVGAAGLHVALGALKLFSVSDAVPPIVSNSATAFCLFLVARDIPYEAALLLAGYSALAVLWDLAVVSVDLDGVLARLNRPTTIFIIIGGMRIVYSCLAARGEGLRLGGTVLLLEFSVCVWLLRKFSNFVVNRGANGSLRGQLDPIEMTAASVLMLMPVGLACLLVGRSPDMRLPILLGAIAVVNARVALPIGPLRLELRNVISMGALLLSFGILSPMLAAFAMQQLGVGNLEVARTRILKSDYELYAPPPNAIVPAPAQGSNYVEIPGLHLAYDLGGEIVFLLPTKTPDGNKGASVLWVLPRDKVQGYAVSAR